MKCIHFFFPEIPFVDLLIFLLLYTVVQEVVSHPPTQEFMAGSTLQMSATPISRVPGNMTEKNPIDIPVPKQQQQPEQPALSIESLDDSFTGTEPSKLSPKGIPQQGKWATPVAQSYSPTPQQWETQSFGVGQQGQTTSSLGEYQHHMYCGPATSRLFGIVPLQPYQSKAPLVAIHSHAHSYHGISSHLFNS